VTWTGRKSVFRDQVFVILYGQEDTDGSTRPTYTGLLWGLEHLKIETRLINEGFVSVV
jgi:hypothetical protein